MIKLNSLNNWNYKDCFVYSHINYIEKIILLLWNKKNKILLLNHMLYCEKVEKIDWLKMHEI